ncbi:hypothetical protein, partial [Floridanema evergladense]
MDATFTNSGFILKQETADDVWIFEAIFAPTNQPNNVGGNERTISVKPLLDAPIVPTKSAEVTPHTQPQSHAQNDTQEINFVPLLFAGIMIASAFFGIGYLVGRESNRTQQNEASYS